MRVFVAGATGALGRPLVAALIRAAHEVVGTTRRPERTPAIEAAGATAVVCDALDRDAVHRAVAASRPDVVVHQLTALPSRFAELRTGVAATNRLRTEGTRHLVDAALAAGVRRVVAESIAFAYSPLAPRIADEQSPIWSDAPKPYDVMVGALTDLERTVTGSAGIEGLVLRYGTLYGPGTWYAPDGDLTTQIRKRRLPIVGDGGGVISFLHVADAASATVAALTGGAPGVYNIVDDEPVSFHDFLPAFAELLDAPPPRHVPAWLARPFAGAVAVATMTEQRGASNRKAREELGWSAGYPSWRDGFAADFRRSNP